jgi:cytochrome c553
MNRMTFVILSLVLMGLVGFYVRAGLEQPEPAQRGPATPANHDITGAHANCLGCHGNITASHDERFGAGGYSDCLSCHAQE